MAVYEEGFSPAAGSPRFTSLVNFAGAALSLALIAGVGVWGYKLVVRDVSGIPVVRAMEGEMRVLPDNPGGDVALHTGLAVNEVAAMGEAGGPEDVLVLAPRSSGLAAEDLEAQLAPEASALLETVIPAVAQDPSETVQAGVTAPTAQAAEPADEIALLAQMLAAGTTMPPPLTTIEIIDPSVPGVATSVRPRLRPVAMTAAASATAEVAVTSAGFAAGTNLVHLGAFASPTEAATAWDSMTARYGAFLTGYDRVIQVSNQSSGTWYRLRASGFADRAEARRLCAVLQADLVECIAVVTN